MPKHPSAATHCTTAVVLFMRTLSPVFLCPLSHHVFYMEPELAPQVAVDQGLNLGNDDT